MNHILEIEVKGKWEAVAFYDDVDWNAAMRDLSARFAQGQNVRCLTDF